jgi:hypothetical protein
MSKRGSIFEETACLSEQQLRDYLSGKLNKAEAHEIEAHLAGCEFCNEALDGLSQVSHQEQIPVIIKQIRNQFRHELQSHASKNKKLKLYIWLTVIIIVILAILLLAYFAINYTMKKEKQGSHSVYQTEITR